MKFDDLPSFLQDRIADMSEDVRQAFLNTIDEKWVAGQVAIHELKQGVDDGRWTWEEVKDLAIESNKNEGN